MEQPPQPSIPPPIGPKGFFTGIKIRPVIVGAVVDFLGTYLATTLYFAVFFLRDVVEKSGASEEAAQEAFQKMLSSPEALLTMFLIGLLGTVLGGYVAGRTAKTEETKHGALVGAVSLVVGLLHSGATGESAVPYWYELLGYIVTIPAGALGGSLALSRNQTPVTDGRNA
jgi:hypothetical protein